MARRKVEVQLQQEIENDEQWDELMTKEGLVVIDVYQSYGGPLRAIEPKLKALKNSLGDDKLHFSLGNADIIKALEFYKGKSEPCFLYYAGGQLVDVTRGANAPLIMSTITTQLEKENKVLKGEAKRKPIKDPYVEKIKKELKREQAAKEVNYLIATGKPITIAIIKPDVLAKGKKDQIVGKIKEKGYEILDHKVVKFTPDMTKEFYKHQSEEPRFSDLVDYMTSGESCVLAMSKEGVDKEEIVKHWRNDIGPTDTHEAKKNPETFRAQYASDELVNSFHGSDSHDAAMRELAFFFPNSTEDQDEDKEDREHDQHRHEPKDHTEHTEESRKDSKQEAAVNTRYEVEVKTADELSAGTDGEILLNIHGDKGEELSVRLNKSVNHKDPFEKNALDKFELDLKDVGKIDKVSIEQTGEKAGPWKLEFVKILHHNLLYRYDVNKWLEAGKMDLEITDIGADFHKYLIDVKTGSENGAGTDSNISIKLIGQSKEHTIELSKDIKISQNKDLFEKGQNDVFSVLESVAFDNLEKIVLTSDCKGRGADWLVEHVRVTIDNKDVYNFTAKKWIKKDALSLELTPS